MIDVNKALQRYMQLSKINPMEMCCLTQYPTMTPLEVVKSKISINKLKYGRYHLVIHPELELFSDYSYMLVVECDLVGKPKEKRWGDDVVKTHITAVVGRTIEELMTQVDTHLDSIVRGDILPGIGEWFHENKYTLDRYID